MARERRGSWWLAAPLVLFGFASAVVRADILVLVDGREFEGHVLKESADEVEFEVVKGTLRYVLVVKRSEIQSLETDSAILARFDRDIAAAPSIESLVEMRGQLPVGEVRSAILEKIDRRIGELLDLAIATAATEEAALEAVSGARALGRQGDVARARERLYRIKEAREDLRPLVAATWLEYSFHTTPPLDLVTSERGSMEWTGLLGERRLRHPGPVVGIVYGPGSDWFAAVDESGTVKIWDAAKVREIRAFGGPETGPGRAIDASRDGRTLATAGGSSAWLWDSGAGRLLHELRGGDVSVEDVAFDPDSKRVASCDGAGTIRIWDVSSGQETRSFAAGFVTRALDWSPDGTRLVAVGAGVPAFFDPDSGEKIASFDPGERKLDELLDVAYRHSGDLVFTAGLESDLLVWRASDGKEVAEFRSLTGGVESASWSPDGRSILFGTTDGSIILANAEDKRDAHPLADWLVTTRAVAMSPDGLRVAIGGRGSHIRIWQAIARSAGSDPRGHLGSVEDLEISADGTRLHSGSLDGTWRTWDTQTGKELRNVEKADRLGVRALALSPDGKWLASGGDNQDNRVWDATSGREVRFLAGKYDRLTAIAFTPEGGRVVLGGANGKVNVCDLESGKSVLEFEAHAGAVSELAILPGGKECVTGGLDGSLKRWDFSKAAKPRKVWKGVLGPVHAVAANPDGTVLASGGAAGVLQLWDVESGNLLQGLSGHPFSIDALAWSEDGRWLYSAGPDFLAAWDAATWRLADAIRADSGPRRIVVRGDRIWVAGADSTIGTYVHRP